MATRREVAAIYAAAVVQGVILVTFPAVAPVFTSPQHFGLSNTAYGSMFVPQAIAAVLASLIGAGLTRRLGGKRLFLIGLVADLASMLFLLASPFAPSSIAYALLLAATCALGVGFGFVVPALNTFTAAFFPQAVEKSILTLNALLGLGTALAPVFAAIFLGLGFWWGLPLLMTVLAIALLLFAATLPLPDAAAAATSSKSPAGIPARFWLFAAFALLYGICETMNGNWSGVYMGSSLGASATVASLALTVFWGTVTAGRVLFAAIERSVPQRITYCALPWLIGLALLATAAVPKGDGIVALGCFALAGLGCSALLPLVIGFAQEELTTMSASVAGGLIGAYQIGYGLAAFGVGPLQAMARLSLGFIFAGTAVVAVALAIISLMLVRGTPATESAGRAAAR